MKNTFNISVIIPAYNAEQFLRRSIAGVLGQTLKPLETIIVDDGSSDRTAQIARSYTDEIRLIQHQKNCGLPTARNTGIKAAQGEWIAFLDADDEWRRCHLENAVKILQSHPEIKWYGASVNQYLHDSGKLINEYKEKKPGILIDNAYFKDYMVAFPPYAHFSAPTMIIHRSVFDKVGLFDKNLRTGQDLDMWYRIGLQFPRIGYCHEVAANIYKRSTSLSYTKKHDYRKSLNIFRKQELLAETSGQVARRRAEPRIMYWVIKLLKANLSRGDSKAVREIFSIYKHRFTARWYWISRIYLLAPWAAHPVFILRNIMTIRNKPPKQAPCTNKQ